MKMTKDEACWIAKASGWLSGESRDFQESLLSRCHLRGFAEKEALFHEGDPCAGVHALVSGVLRIEFATPDRDYRIASVKQPVFWSGSGASMRRGAYFVTATAASPVTTLFLPHHEFERLVEDAGHCRAFARLSLEHYDEAQNVVGQLLIGDVEQRVAARLALLAEKSGGPLARDQSCRAVALCGAERSPLPWRFVDGVARSSRGAGGAFSSREARLALLAEKSGGPQPPVIPVTQADLAEMCGLSRLTIQQVLNALEKRGFIKAGYRKITVLDAGALVGRVGSPDPAKAGAIV